MTLLLVLFPQWCRSANLLSVYPGDRGNKEVYSLTLDMQELLLYLFCILSGALFDRNGS